MQRRRFSHRILALGLACAVAPHLFGAGYKLPEQSLRSVALSAAYVAGTVGADTSYYNPANMGWMDEAQYVEGALTLIHLPAVEYRGTVRDYAGNPLPADSQSKTEDFLVPTLHYVGPRFGNWRFGLSAVAPGGLSKRWNDQPQRSVAEEFTLSIIELNPTFSYTFNDRWSVGGGLRVVYTDGTVRAYGVDPNIPMDPMYAQNLEGDSFDFGYNLALSFRPQPETVLSVTYRSNVDLTVEGTAKGGIPLAGIPWFDTDADVEVPLPATLAVAAAHDFGRVRLEVVYERTYWSEYEELDFNYDDPAVEAFLGKPKDKDWKDTDTLRIGLTWHVNKKWDMLFGYAWDETPIPEKTVGFELPDSDAQIFSVGSVIRIDENWEAGFAMLYDSKKERRVHTPPNENGIEGKFDEGGAYLATVGVGYRF